MAELLPFLVVGFCAQLVDGVLGMAYGVISATLLMAWGLSPSIASLHVHLAEIVTTGISGISHGLCGNVDRSLLRGLVAPGMAGAAIGASVLGLVSVQLIRPVVSVYLLFIGLFIIFSVARARKAHSAETGAMLTTVGTVGGFLDAVGGGGWGTIVTSTLLGRGHEARRVIGSVNAAEFFVAVTTSAILLTSNSAAPRNGVLGLLIGGALAAPIAARLCRTLPSKRTAVLAGVLVVGLSLVDLCR